MEEKLYKEVLVNLQKRYNKINEILNITVDMEDALNRNDNVVLEMLLNMRQDSMIQASECDDKISDIFSTLDDCERERLNKMISGDENQTPQNDFEEKMQSIFLKGQNILNRIITIDKVINKRLAGENSYYEKNKL